MSKKLLYYGWIIVSIFLFLYSFTQVDLGLTLTRISVWQIIQKSFQYIGYFQRPLSSVLFIFILIIFFLLYIITLKLVSIGRLGRSDVWKIILAVGIILMLSYNAFSYDLFNYIFDAKIITYYGQNPYLHKALDYPGDPMLSFMHWTHRVYPYGPTWLVLTIPLSFIGFGYFLGTFYLFKTLMFAAYLGTVYFIGKIAVKTKVSNQLFPVVFFALNPLILIESLVSAHNDIVMMFFTVCSFYLLLEKKYLLSFVVLILSAGIKFATLILLPVYIYFLLKHKKKNYNHDTVFYFSIILMIVSVFIASYRTNYQPWYLLFVFPLASFLSRKYFILIPAFIFSLFSLLQYTQFLYLGNWDPPVPLILSRINYFAFFISILIIAFWFVKQKIAARHKMV